jgi:hypothetical protein
MVVKKGPPTLGWRLRAADEVLAHARLTDVDAELQKLAVKTLRTPARILFAHAADQVANLAWDSRTPRLASADLPPPEEAKRVAVPCNDDRQSAQTRESQTDTSRSAVRNRECLFEAMAVGIREMTDLEVAGASADAIKYFAELLKGKGIPIVTPPGGLACHLDASRFVAHLPQSEYPAGALAAAVYITSGIRGMERGSVSMDRDEEGNDVPSDMELLRLAVPRRVYTMSHYQYAADRLRWLYDHRTLVGGLEFYEEPPVLRFFGGKMKPKGNDWGSALADAFQREFGTDC